MVNVLRKNEPIWISKINRRMSIFKFHENASQLRSVGIDISRVLSNLTNCREVYEVIVETWTKGDVTILVPFDYVETTGEMLTRFLKTNEQNEESTLVDTLVDDATFSDLIELENEEEEEEEESIDETALELDDIPL